MGGCIFTFFKVCIGVRQGSVLSPYLFALYLDDLIDGRTNGRTSLVILNADDIIILSSTLTEPASWMWKRANLAWYVYQYKKSYYLRIGHRFDSKCCQIATLNGHSLPWVNELKYLGIFVTSSRTVKCSLDYAKRAYYCSLDAIFGKIGRNASEEVVLQLIASKFIPIRINGSEARCLKQSDIRSLDFAVNRFPMKLFKTANVNVVHDCVT